MLRLCAVVFAALAAVMSVASAEDHLEPIQYNNPGLVVDLGVGLWAWPLPMDYDRDGDLDLVVSCPDKPYNGTYFFENPGASPESGVQSPELPVFKPARRIAHGPSNVQVSYINGEPVVMTPGQIHANFRDEQYSNPIKLKLPVKIDPQYKRYRANQWKLVDWEADGDLDIIIGIGIWDDYGWDDAWDENGNWTNGPLHGFVYLVENESSVESPESRAEKPLEERLRALVDAKFAEPRKLKTTDGKPVDVYGMPSPNLADFDGDGDLDLICGEFLDGFTFFENTSAKDAPKFGHGRRLMARQGPLTMDLQMITPVAVDWDLDGETDLICGDEDGRVAFIESYNWGKSLSLREQKSVGIEQLNAPLFATPHYFQQQASDVKYGALVTPYAVDWDRDGDEDLICGNTAGYIGIFENLDGATEPQWGAPEFVDGYLSMLVDGLHAQGFSPIRAQAGEKGSIQGPCEAKWGYTTLSAAEWESVSWEDEPHYEVIFNDIWGRVKTHNVAQPLASPEPVKVAWTENPKRPSWSWWKPTNNELMTQWRTTPCVLDWNQDGLNDLVMLDHEGYLSFYERTQVNPDAKEDSGLTLLPPRRIFKIKGPCEFNSRHGKVGDKQDGLLRLNAERAGRSGRRKLCFVDWDGDGRRDLLVNSVNVNWLRNVRTDDEGFTWFKDMGQLDSRVLAGHTTSPTTVDWDNNGIPDLLVGAEDGRLYYKKNPRTEPTEIELERLEAKKQQVEKREQSRVENPESRAGEQTSVARNSKAQGLQPLGLDAVASAPQKTDTESCGDDALNNAGQSPVVLSEFIYGNDDSPTPQCHASTMAETPNGLVAAWFGGTREKNPDVGIWISRQTDNGWTRPVEVMNGVQHADLRYPCWNPVLFQQPGGPLHLFAKCGPNPREWWGTHQTSDDYGVTWTDARRLPSQIDGPVKNKPVLLKNGTLLCGSSTEYDGWRVHFEMTSDWGKTWKRVGPINDASEFNAIQPTILTHKDGTLQILCRAQERNIVTSRSSDGGQTWSRLERSTLPNPNSGIDAVTLADGRHLLIYNHTKRGRSPLNLAMSEDGANWQAGLILESEPGEYSYPAVIQTSDGLVHITYTWKRTTVKHVVVDPKQLKLRPIVNGEWPS